jgi:hypothetical protein
MLEHPHVHSDLSGEQVFPAAVVREEESVRLSNGGEDSSIVVGKGEG